MIHSASTGEPEEILAMVVLVIVARLLYFTFESPLELISLEAKAARIHIYIYIFLFWGWFWDGTEEELGGRSS